VKKPPGNQPPHQPPAPRPQSVSLSTTTTVLTGPLPSPEILIQYNQAVPGAADRIIAMAEHDSAHLQTMERMTLTAFYQERRLGQILGFCIAAMFLAASVYLAINGHEVAASVLGGTTLVSLVSIFVVGRLSRSSSNQNNSQSQPEKTN
jgi:uncharacterized membrane protein